MKYLREEKKVRKEIKEGKQATLCCWITMTGKRRVKNISDRSKAWHFCKKCGYYFY
jgi:hypothetical protein